MKKDKPVAHNTQPANTSPVLDKIDKVFAGMTLAGMAAMPVGIIMQSNEAAKAAQTPHVSTDTGNNQTGDNTGLNVVLGGVVVAGAGAVGLYARSRRRLIDELESRGIDPKGRVY